MHPNPSFRKSPLAQNLAFARKRGFGILSVNAENGPIIAHVPFLLADDGTYADFHLARSNAVVSVGKPARAVIAVSGPDGYVSPDWYGVADQVPTWNYIAVHLRGRLEPLPPDALAAHLNALADRFEADLLPKPVWKSAKMGDGVMDRMMRMILPFRLIISDVEGTWKLNQNKTAAARTGVIAAMEAIGGLDAEVALAMRDLPADGL